GIVPLKSGLMISRVFGASTSGLRPEEQDPASRTTARTGTARNIPLSYSPHGLAGSRLRAHSGGVSLPRTDRPLADRVHRRGILRPGRAAPPGTAQPRADPRRRPGTDVRERLALAVADPRAAP